MSKVSVAIDGPAAAGKSTIAKLLAERFNYIYIDTGAMYRALTYAAINAKLDLESERELFALLREMKIELKPSINGQLVFINGEEVTDKIRSNEVSNNVSIVAAYRSVREEMVERQRELSEGASVVMDGRDIGTHVLPHAEVKIYMIASVDERAQRRYEENVKKGISADLSKLKEEISQRDKLDMEREVSPLKKADDAIELDTTSLTIHEVVEKISNLINERVG
ncbi:(d)CMP kinase [Bacillus solimangrovi]|uniref:Cytidylate kinase n=1 Tax=Bacillus solimangrovi TaxID=1305675 RepID=A0A1E5LHC4_9BACI|nr:(d)CMP kinase [Bacillus solimangrovi]OEH93475.1 cytidylate kinase [Bacillus solimangrovi]